MGALGVVIIIVLLLESGHSSWFYGTGVLSDGKVVKKIEAMDQIIDDYYLDTVTKEELANGLYSGLFYGLGDPYARYYTPEEYAQEAEYNAGSYVGIGVEIRETNDGILINTCYEGAAADIAGVEAGDILLEVDGETVAGLTLSEVAEKIRKEVGDSVTLLVRRQGFEEPLEILVPVTDVVIPSVTGKMLENKIGYIQILEFNGSSYEQYHQTFENLESEGMEKLVIDLRDNPGGLLNAVCEILEEILPEGLIVYTEDKYGERDEHFCSGEHPLEIPLVVLVNGESASASEIFAGAVQDYGIGTIVGTTTYGKGIVQSIMTLEDGSAVKLTVANYYTPNGNNIHKIGIQPDVVVEADAEISFAADAADPDEISITDPQLATALEILMEE